MKVTEISDGQEGEVEVERREKREERREKRDDKKERRKRGHSAYVEECRKCFSHRYWSSLRSDLR